MNELWVIEKKASISLFDVYKRIRTIGNLRQETISARNHGIREALFWNLLTLGKCCTYRLYSEDDETIIHESYVIHRCFKFPFLKRNDIEVGPCNTNEKWRGKGIYPNVLRIIIENELSIGERAYMIIDENNVSSIRGVIKAGYRRIGSLRKSKILKIYRLCEQKA